MKERGEERRGEVRWIGKMRDMDEMEGAVFCEIAGRAEEEEEGKLKGIYRWTDEDTCMDFHIWIYK